MPVSVNKLTLTPTIIVTEQLSFGSFTDPEEDGGGLRIFNEGLISLSLVPSPGNLYHAGQITLSGDAGLGYMLSVPHEVPLVNENGGEPISFQPLWIRSGSIFLPGTLDASGTAFETLGGILTVYAGATPGNLSALFEITLLLQ